MTLPERMSPSFSSAEILTGLPFRWRLIFRVEVTSLETVWVGIGATVAHPFATNEASMAVANFVRFCFCLVLSNKVPPWLWPFTTIPG